MVDGLFLHLRALKVGDRRIIRSVYISFRGLMIIVLIILMNSNIEAARNIVEKELSYCFSLIVVSAAICGRDPFT